MADESGALQASTEYSEYKMDDDRFGGELRTERKEEGVLIECFD
jgi:hypothetical protein